MAIGVRDLKEEDIDIVQELFSQLTDEITNSDFKSLIDNENCFCRVLEIEGEVIAFGSLTLRIVPTKGIVATVEDLIVEEDHQTHGYGELLLENLLGLAKHKKAVRVDLTSNPKRIKAQRLYEKFRFVKVNTNLFTKKIF